MMAKLERVHSSKRRFCPEIVENYESVNDQQQMKYADTLSKATLINIFAATIDEMAMYNV